MHSSHLMSTEGTAANKPFWFDDVPCHRAWWRVIFVAVYIYFNYVCWYRLLLFMILYIYLSKTFNQTTYFIHQYFVDILPSVVLIRKSYKMISIIHTNIIYHDWYVTLMDAEHVYIYDHTNYNFFYHQYIWYNWSESNTPIFHYLEYNIHIFLSSAPHTKLSPICYCDDRRGSTGCKITMCEGCKMYVYHMKTHVCRQVYWLVIYHGQVARFQMEWSDDGHSA